MQYITNVSRTDGFGAQFQSVLWIYLWAELTNKNFVYSDIKHIDLISNSGSVKDTEDENTLDEVSDFMGFNKFCIKSDSVKENINNTSEGVSYDFVQKNMDYVFNSKAFLTYKEFFYKDKVNRFNKEYMNVAIHIRKLGNFERENGRFRAGTHDIPDEYYLDKMNLIRNHYSDKNVLFHVYSQGSKEMFKNFIYDDTVLHLNEKILDTFTDLIFADILVTCRSSFSYLAGMLSNNKVYYLTFWHPPLSQWIKF
jgi:hypothetical protein